MNHLHFMAAISVCAVLLTTGCDTPSMNPALFKPDTLRIYPKTIDGYLYDGPGDPCDPNGNSDAITKVADYLEYWSEPTKVEIYYCRYIKNKTIWSAHSSWRAVDLYYLASNPEERLRADVLVWNLLLSDGAGNKHALARRMGIEQIIWNHRIWTSDRPDDGFRPIEGDTDPHTNHVHIQINKAAKAGFITFLGDWDVIGGAPGCDGPWCADWVPISSYAGYGL